MNAWQFLSFFYFSFERKYRHSPYGWLQYCVVIWRRLRPGIPPENLSRFCQQQAHHKYGILQQRELPHQVCDVYTHVPRGLVNHYNANTVTLITPSILPLFPLPPSIDLIARLSTPPWRVSKAVRNYSVSMGIQKQFAKSNFAQFVNRNVKILGERLYSSSLRNVAWLTDWSVNIFNFQYRVCL